MLAVLSQALEERDPYTRGHSERVTELAEAVALRLGWDEAQLRALRLGGALHDVGKLAVAPAILRKAGPLTQAEVAIVRQHPIVGARLIAPIPGARVALSYVLYHHERWDGRGYPTGRAGTEIPLEARLLALADAFDAITSGRPYREPMSANLALAEIDRCSGTQFDPALAEAFLDVWDVRATAVAAG